MTTGAGAWRLLTRELGGAGWEVIGRPGRQTASAQVIGISETRRTGQAAGSWSIRWSTGQGGQTDLETCGTNRIDPTVFTRRVARFKTSDVSSPDSPAIARVESDTTE